jgi:hypothetical protein
MHQESKKSEVNWRFIWVDQQVNSSKYELEK